MGLIVNGVDLATAYNFVTRAVTGRGLPAFEHTTIELPLRNGAVYKRTRIPPRNIQIVGLVYGTTAAEARQKLDELMSFLSSSSELTIRFPDTNRYINARLSSASEYTAYGPVFAAFAYQVVLNFVAHDPYFYDDANNAYLTG